MRINTNIKEHGTFEEAAAAFLRFKQANQISKRTMDDYIKTFKKFAAVSSNTMEFKTLTSDLLDFFSQIPDTSPAVFNRPFSNLNALFNWCVKQDMLQKNPLVALDLHKKKDEGNISTGHSLDSRKRVPRYTPCAPSISAAAIYRPVPCSRRRQGEDNFRVRRSGRIKIHPKKEKTCTFCAGFFQRDLALFRLIHI